MDLAASSPSVPASASGVSKGPPARSTAAAAGVLATATNLAASTPHASKAFNHSPTQASGSSPPTLNHDPSIPASQPMASSSTSRPGSSAGHYQASPQYTPNHSQHQGTSPSASTHHRKAHISAATRHQSAYYQQHTTELAGYISTVFLPSVLPTNEEYSVKEQTRLYLETLAKKVCPGCHLLPFGSIASGLALRNSDMDLCCILSDNGSASGAAPRSSSSELVERLAAVIQSETAFIVKPLPKARIPIIKLSLPPSLGQPFGLSCDIGFENRLALENTRLLLTYSWVDPRMRTIVLFLKVWVKRRRINDPYLGTLSSYGYVLLVVYFLINARKQPVLPNLQTLPPPRPMTQGELEMDGHNIYFFDDIDALPQYWTPMNRENVAELLIDFFRYFSSTFRYSFDVISIRTNGGLISKESKGWLNDYVEEGTGGRFRVDLHRLCIEDPFQTNYNVARTVTRDGLFTIRGEFMRAVRVLSTRTDRIDTVIRELCEERQEGVLMAPPSNSSRRKSTPQGRSPVLGSQPPISGFRAWGPHNAHPAGPNSAPAAPPTPYSQASQIQSPPRRQNALRLPEMQGQTIDEDSMLGAFSLESTSPRAGYPALTTRVMQDHAWRQVAATMDARPRYPPESVASEPAPLDRDMDWHMDNSVMQPNGAMPSSSADRFHHYFTQLPPDFAAASRSSHPRSVHSSTAPASPVGATMPLSQSGSACYSYQQNGFACQSRSSSHGGARGESEDQPVASFTIGGKLPDFSRLPIVPIRFGNFATGAPEGLGASGEDELMERGRQQSSGAYAEEASTPKGKAREVERGGSAAPKGSPAQLPRKIVFGDVEVTTDAMRGAREQALTALLRPRRATGPSQRSPPRTPPKANGVRAHRPRKTSEPELPASPTTPTAPHQEVSKKTVYRGGGKPRSKRTHSQGSRSRSPGSSVGGSGPPSFCSSSPATSSPPSPFRSSGGLTVGAEAEVGTAIGVPLVNGRTSPPSPFPSPPRGR